MSRCLEAEALLETAKQVTVTVEFFENRGQMRKAAIASAAAASCLRQAYAAQQAQDRLDAIVQEAAEARAR